MGQRTDNGNRLQVQVEEKGGFLGGSVVKNPPATQETQEI